MPAITRIYDQMTVDFEAERRARVLIIPQPNYNANQRPEKVRFALLAEPPLTRDENDQVHFAIAADPNLPQLDPNPEEAFANSEAGGGFIGDYTGDELAHGIQIASHLARALGVVGTRMILHNMHATAPDPEAVPQHFLVIV